MLWMTLISFIGSYVFEIVFFSSGEDSKFAKRSATCLPPGTEPLLRKVLQTEETAVAAAARWKRKAVSSRTTSSNGPTQEPRLGQQQYLARRNPSMDQEADSEVLVWSCSNEKALGRGQTLGKRRHQASSPNFKQSPGKVWLVLWEARGRGLHFHVPTRT